VPELSHDAADDGFHEIQLSGKQLVFLFMATTVVSVVIFLCGVLVGRGVRPASASGAPVAASVTPAPPPADSVSSPPPPSGAAPAAPPATAEDLTYHRRLQGEPGSAGSTGATDEKLKTQETEPPKPVDPPAAVASAPPPGPEGGWVVQIAALRDRAAADAIVRRLTAKGYPTFMLETAPGTPAPGYRVRVGRFGDRREAEQVARRLEREEQFRPFITR
jgi:cell division septation protein DedD